MFARGIAAVVVLAAMGWASAHAADEKIENPFPNRLPAVELEGGVAWLNGGPLTLNDVKGKIVLLDFWTFCCINCMHVLPDLKYLEKKYPNEVVVIGVHSAKFDQEKETDAIRDAVLRYEIEHPVVNDANMAIWRKFQVRAWPTLVLIDPEGFYCGYVSGEGNREVLEQVIDKLIAFHKMQGTLNEKPFKPALERDQRAPTPLHYPGKILADEAGQRLFIADSNHNRIVVTNPQGQLLELIGDGTVGQRDGSFAEAQFNHPQGMCLIKDRLYVADTENHLLRVVDLKAGKVETLAGTGEQARGRDDGGALRETALNSPWDVCVVDDALLIAMAGPHQIWSHRLGSKRIGVFAGSGREDVKNGNLAGSAFAQPSGIVADGRKVYVVCSEGSAIRKINLSTVASADQPQGQVTTLAGTSDLPNARALFEFGDIDGVGKAARLQHPIGLTRIPGALLVADTYNQKIKRVDLATGECTTWAGGGVGGGEQPLTLSEPAGLTVLGGKVYVADTNQHRIVEIDIESRAAQPLVIQGLLPPATNN